MRCLRTVGGALVIGDQSVEAAVQTDIGGRVLGHLKVTTMPIDRKRLGMMSEREETEPGTENRKE